MRGKIKEIIKKLIRDGFIIQKPTSYDIDVSLNFEMKKDIFDIIERWKLK